VFKNTSSFEKIIACGDMNLVVSVAGEVGGSEFSKARQREDTEHVATL
jgi:hypothetical protein